MTEGTNRTTSTSMWMKRKIMCVFLPPVAKSMFWSIYAAYEKETIDDQLNAPTDGDSLEIRFNLIQIGMKEVNSGEQWGDGNG